MLQLGKFLGVGDGDLSDKSIILLRLLGRPFLHPIKFDLGEQPGDVLVAYLQQSSLKRDITAQQLAIEPFLNLMVMLISEGATSSDRGEDTTDRLISELAPDERSIVAAGVIRVLEHAEISVERGALLETVTQRLNPLPPISEDMLGIYWHLMLSSFAQNALSDDDIPISRAMVTSKAFLEGPIFVLARTRPVLFIDFVVPIIFDALKKKTIDESKAVEVMRLASPVAFRSMYSNRSSVATAHIPGSLRLLASQIEVLTETGQFRSVGDTIISGAASASNINRAMRKTGRRKVVKAMPFDHIAEIESGISRGRARAAGNALVGHQDAVEEVLWHHADAVKHRWGNVRHLNIDPVVSTNLIPYAEGIYFIIWREILAKAGVTVELKQQPWGEVIDALVQDNLSFAIWNDFVEGSSELEGKSFNITSDPLLTYEGYPLVIRRDTCEELLQTIPPGLERKKAVRALATGNDLAWDTFVGCPDLREALRQKTIGVVHGSDIASVAKFALGGHLEAEEPCSSDEAVERLINGKIDAAFLGGIQSSYLKSRFGVSTFTLTMVPRKTSVHFWFRHDDYVTRKYNILVPVLLEAWSQTVSLWRRISAPKAEGVLHLRRWVECLAYDMSLQKHIDSVRTPVLGWSNLDALAKRHDTLGRPEMVRKVSPTKGNVINWSDIQRKNRSGEK